MIYVNTEPSPFVTRGRPTSHHIRTLAVLPLGLSTWICLFSLDAELREPRIKIFISLGCGNDASKGNSGVEGRKGVFYGDMGNWLKGFSVNFGLCSSVNDELLALLKELKIAKAEGYSHLLVHFYLQVILSEVRQLTEKKHPGYNVIK